MDHGDAEPVEHGGNGDNEGVSIPCDDAQNEVQTKSEASKSRSVGEQAPIQCAQCSPLDQGQSQRTQSQGDNQQH